MGAFRNPEPLAFQPSDAAEPEVNRAQPAGPVLLTRLEKADSLTGFASRTVPGALVLPLRRYVIGASRPVARAIDYEPSPRVSPRISPSFRKLLIFAALALTLAVLMAFVLASTRPQQVDPRPVAAPAHTNLQTSAPTLSAPVPGHPAKPSAYGEAFLPPRATPRSRPTAVPRGPTATPAQ